jgi:hypothetical protein
MKPSPFYRCRRRQAKCRRKDWRQRVAGERRTTEGASCPKALVCLPALILIRIYLLF